MNKPQGNGVTMTALECAREISTQAAEILWTQGYDDAADTIAHLLDEPIAVLLEAYVQQRCAGLIEALEEASSWPQIESALAQFKGENVDAKQ